MLERDEVIPSAFMLLSLILQLQNLSSGELRRIEVADFNRVVIDVKDLLLTTFR